MAEKNLFNLTGKVSLVTGAGSGLGRVFCEAMAEYGSDVVCSDINETWAKETAGIIAKYGVKTLVVKADVSKQDEIKALFGKVDQEFGRLDVLFNNAGITTKGVRLHERRLEDWDKVIAVNLTGTFLCMQEGIKLMLRQKSGSIINISSLLGLVATAPDILATEHYTASKHGVIGLTKTAAVQYGPDNIRVNAIAPGFYGGTRLGNVEGRSEDEAQAWAEKTIKKLIPLGRFAEAKELKGLAVFLASDASSYVTGATYVTDGGCSAW
jgi:NAD(P)-dependent dehydrogenase (short-subunit alcohol dehydrogenase family)